MNGGGASDEFFDLTPSNSAMALSLLMASRSALEMCW